MWWSRKSRIRRERESAKQASDPSDDQADDEEVFVMPIEDAIDLHHFRPSEIIEIVDAYLEAAQERGFGEVRLIHGRGKGVQRARVQRFLSECPRVASFTDAPPGRGGWGATVVTLESANDPGIA